MTAQTLIEFPYRFLSNGTQLNRKHGERLTDYFQVLSKRRAIRLALNCLRQLFRYMISQEAEIDVAHI